MPRIAINSRRSRTSCSILALATVLAVGATPAAAQSFLGTGTYVTNPNATGIVAPLGGTTTTINLNAGQTVIDWTPTDNATNAGAPIAFQNSGTIATFTSGSDFAVLNRITPADMSRAIHMNGTVNARVGNVQRGSVYFYSPNGFVFGGTSVFSVGSLVVTTSPPTVTDESFINGTTVEFGQTLNPDAAISSNGIINANYQPLGFPGPADSSYVAMIAPHVSHGGAITVNGSAALVAAEAATINFSPDGLFNIQVTAGTDSRDAQNNPNGGVFVHGDIGGPTPIAATDKQSVFLVAVPKNQLLTMVIGNGADLGFTLANDASIDANGAVVLSAGHDISFGSPSFSPSSAAGADANISVVDAHFTSSVMTQSTGFTHLQGFNALTFDSNLTVNSLGEVWLASESASGSVDVAGDLSISTDRFGSFGGESVTAANIIVATGGGGSIEVGTVQAGNTISLSANAFGGGSESSGINGGNATGGIVEVVAHSGGSITLNGDLSVSAVGQGGSVFSLGINGGNGTGGFSKNYTIDDGSTITYNGDVTIDVSGYGADGAGVECFCDGFAGNGQGGTVWYSAQAGVGSTFTVNGSTLITGNGVGGFAGSQNGGLGTGGNLQVFFGDQATTTLNGDLTMVADGTGGGSESGSGGTGQGGKNYIFRTNAPLTAGALVVTGSVAGSVTGQGGDAQNSGTGGAGVGGLFEIGTDVGSITLTGTVIGNADGSGGDSAFGTGGAGTGGNGASGGSGVYNFGGGLIDLQQGGSFTAIGTGGSGGSGGAGTGGDTFLGADGGTIQLGASVTLASAGIGGESSSGNAGNGKGGVIDAGAINGGELQIDGTLFASAPGEGGYSFGAGNGGLGTGGDIEVLATGDGSVTIDGGGYIDADGYGGSAGIVSTGNGGNGQGGTIDVHADGGAVEFGFDLYASADGEGGFSDNATGGNGDGGKVAVRAIGEGTVHLIGAANLSASGSGGDGVTGGNATAVVPPVEGETPAVMILADGGGSVTIDGQTTLHADASGGDGSGGNGGNASAGEIDVIAGIGSISLQALDASADALGGDGGLGGNGGTGKGGGVFVSWLLEGPLGGTITATSADLSANGQGGAGGVGQNAATGGNGGDGGAGTGGVASAVGSAAGGMLDLGDSLFAANGTGGNGGAGGAGSDGPGGAGGAGGSGTAGRVQLGTISHEGKSTTGGSADYDNVTATANATGGDGGDGGSGTSGAGAGAGGNGGNALGGVSGFLARGVLVTADIVNLAAIATGGDGGSGSVQGNGGNATSGLVNVESKDRFGHPTQRGTLTATSITGTAIATGGSGANPGTSTVLGGSFFRVLNGDADIGTLSFTFAGTAYDGAGGPNLIQAQDGTGTIGSFTYDTTGQLAVYTTNTGTLDVGALTLSAGNFIDHPTLVGPAVPGTIFADSLSVTSGGDFIADANLDVDNGIDITVPGSIRFDNASTSSGVDLWAQGGSIQIGNVNASSSVSLVADSFIDGGNIAAGGAIFGQALDGDIQLGSLTSTFSTIFLDAAGDISVSGDMLADGDIELFADGNIFVDNASSGESIVLDAGGYLDEGGGYVDGLNLTAGDSIEVVAAEWVDLGNLSAGLVNASTNEGAEHSTTIIAGGNILAGDIAAAENIGLATPGTITTDDINAGGIFMALAHGDMSFGDATASEVFLSDYAILNLTGLTATCLGACGSLGANGVVTAPPTGSSYAYVTTDGGVDGAGQLPGVGGEATNGTIYTTSEFEVSAGDALDFWFNYVTSDGSGFADYAWAGLFTPSLDPVAILYTARTQPEGTIVPGQGLPGVEATLNPASVPIIDGAPVWAPLGDSSGFCYGPGCGYTGWVSSSYEIAEAGSYVLRFGVTNWTDTGYQSGMAFSGLSIGGVSATPVLLTRTGGSISIGNVDTGKFSAAAGTSLTTGIIDSGGAITLDAGGAISTQNLFAGNFVLANGGSITTGHIEADSVDMTSTGGNILTGDIDAFGDVTLDAFADIETQDIVAGTIDLHAGGDITTLTLTTEQQVLVELAEGFEALLFPGASITLESGGDIATGAINSIDGVYADAGGSLTTGSIDAVDFVELLANNNIVTQAITAGDFIDIESTNGGIQTQSLLADGDIHLDAFGNISFVSANTASEFDFSAGGSVSGGNVVAGHEIGGEAGGTVNLGNLTAGLSVDEDDDFSVGIAAVGNITVENVSGEGHVGFVTQGNLQTGNLTAGDLVLTLVGGNTTTGSITTTGEFGQVYMADDSMYFDAGGTIDGEGDVDAEDILALDPVATGGSITINGDVDTNLFRAAAGTSLSTQDIFASEIEASAGGTATLNGVWDFTEAATLESNDIDITSTGGIDGGTTGDILLISTNPTQMLVGDGLSGTGYALSNAEFGRLSGTDVGIVGRGDASAPVDMLIGDLTVTGPAAGSTIESSEGILVFAVGDIDSESASGVIRVVGDINATGFGSGNAIEFYADRFELDAATGSISILSSGSTLGGELGLYADRIHVAEGSILNQLASNPTYTNYQQDLNEAATVQRPEGVLRADTLWIESDNLQDILIQNTGTAATPAGFLVRQAFVNEDFEVAGPSGSINMVVNGQVVTEGGTLTGIAARDELITEETDTTPFTANSTINGCPLTGACIIAPPPPPPTANVVDNQIDLITGNPLGEGEFGNEDSIDDGEEGDEGAQNPISPPQPLFDTRPLIPSSDVNDPVSGTGNPALLGGVGDCVDDENNQCGTKKESGE